MELTTYEKAQRTHRAAELLVAAELVRRNYTVSFITESKTPEDLAVTTRGGKQFWVDIKGLSSKADFLVRPREQKDNLFYILVLVNPPVTSGENYQPDHFYILTQAEANQLEERYRKERPMNKTSMPGFAFRDAEPHRDRWDKLPRDDT